MKKNKTRRIGTMIKVGTEKKIETEIEGGKERGKKGTGRRSMNDDEETEKEGMAMIGVMKNQDEIKEEPQHVSA